LNIDRKKLYFLIEQSNSTGREESEIKKKQSNFWLNYQAGTLNLQRRNHDDENQWCLIEVL